MTPEKTFIFIVFDINQTFFELFNSLGNSKTELPITGLYFEMFTYSPLIDSIIQPDPSLIQLSILYKISLKDLSRLNSELITILVVGLK